MKKVIFISIISLLFISSCKKDPELQSGPSIPLQDLPAYSHFKLGTYWVYKDSTSGIEDSMYVYSDTAYIYYNPGNGVQEAGNYMYYDRSEERRVGKECRL